MEATLYNTNNKKSKIKGLIIYCVLKTMRNWILILNIPLIQSQINGHAQIIQNSDTISCGRVQNINNNNNNNNNNKKLLR